MQDNDDVQVYYLTSTQHNDDQPGIISTHVQLPALEASTLLYLIDHCQLSDAPAPAYASEDQELSQLLATAADHDAVLAALGARLLSLTGHAAVPSVPPFYACSDKLVWSYAAAASAADAIGEDSIADDDEEDDLEVELLGRETLLAVEQLAWIVELRCKDRQAAVQEPCQVMHEDDEENACIVGAPGDYMLGQEAPRECM